MRAQYELATRARHDGSTLCFWDRRTGRFRALNPKWAPIILSWGGAIDPHEPSTGRGPIRELLSFRHRIIMALEQFRLTTGSVRLARLADRLQRAVLALRKHGFPLEDRQGNRLPCVPYEAALGDEVALGANDVLLLSGTDWYHIDAAAIGALKQQVGVCLAVVCYDLIPLLYPAFFPADDLARVRRYWSAILPIADLVICNSRVVEADAHGLAREPGGIRASAVAPLGFELPAIGTASIGTASIATASMGTAPDILPPGLTPGNYALLVSTIEPRKGHTLLLEVWERLLARGIPQRHGFRLVFVGRSGWQAPGWNRDAVMRKIDALSRDATLLHLQGVGDAELDALYRNAAFCLYPSLYEGFGLPIIEAFARGKAVIASTGGAVPETAGDLAPCLDPTDATAWEQLLGDWITRPELSAAYEARIRAGSSHLDWAQAATNILSLARSAGEVCSGAQP